MRRLIILLILAMPVVANAGAMRCKSALISEGDSSFNVQKKGGQPQMKEDIIDERRKIEYQVLWLEGALSELRHRLIRIRELEDYALEMLAKVPADL